jgi:hypothetical protein
LLIFRMRRHYLALITAMALSNTLGAAPQQAPASPNVFAGGPGHSRQVTVYKAKKIKKYKAPKIKRYKAPKIDRKSNRIH